MRMTSLLTEKRNRGAHKNWNPSPYIRLRTFLYSSAWACLVSNADIVEFERIERHRIFYNTKACVTAELQNTSMSFRPNEGVLKMIKKKEL